MKRKWTPEEVRQWYDRHGLYVYCNPEDGNWIVRKAWGLGWTMNLANPRTWLFLAGVLAVLLLLEPAQSLGRRHRRCRRANGDLYYREAIIQKNGLPSGRPLTKRKNWAIVKVRRVLPIDG